MKGLKRRAFTLVELLVVVLVLGVLAAVAAPKFKRVLETRKTTEAEDMLSAIRTEQEKRCIMGKNYTKNKDKVPVLANATNSPNYTYTLGSTGVSAQGNGYELKMLSYKEGTICCSGSGCAKLNKNYTDCSTLTAPTDEECAAVVEETSETTSEPEPECSEDISSLTNTITSGKKTCTQSCSAASCVNGELQCDTWVTDESSCHCTNRCLAGKILNEETCTCETAVSLCDISQKSNYEGDKEFTLGDGYCVTTGHAECNSSKWKRVEDSRTCYCYLPNGNTLETGNAVQLGREIINSSQDHLIHFHVGSMPVESNGIYRTMCSFNNNYTCKTEYFGDIGSGPVLDWNQSCYSCHCFDGTSNSNNTWSCGCSGGGGGNASEKVYKYKSTTVNSTQYTNCGYPDAASYASDLAYQAGFRGDKCSNLHEGDPCQAKYPSCWSHISCGASYGTSQNYIVEGLVCE